MVYTEHVTRRGRVYMLAFVPQPLFHPHKGLTPNLNSYTGSDMKRAVLSSQNHSCASTCVLFCSPVHYQPKKCPSTKPGRVPKSLKLDYCVVSLRSKVFPTTHFSQTRSLNSVITCSVRVCCFGESDAVVIQKRVLGRMSRAAVQDG